MAKDENNKNDDGKFSFGEQAPNEAEDDFDFSQIPVLGQEQSEKKDSFSFETFHSPEDEASKPEAHLDEHLSNYAKILKDESLENEDPAEDDTIKVEKPKPPERKAKRDLPPPKRVKSDSAEEEAPEQPNEDAKREEHKAKWRQIIADRKRNSSSFWKTALVVLVVLGLASSLVVGTFWLIPYFTGKDEPDPAPSGPKPVRKPKPEKVVKATPKVPKKVDPVESKIPVETETDTPLQLVESENGDKTDKKVAVKTDPKPETTTDEPKPGDKAPPPEAKPSEKPVEVKVELTEEEKEAMRLAAEKQRQAEYESLQKKIKRFAKLKKIVATGDKAKVAAAYAFILKKYPNSLKEQLKAQDYLIAADMFEEALNIYRKWHEERKSSALSNHLLGRILKDLSLSKEYYEKAIRINRTFIPAYLALGHLYEINRDWAGAEKVYKDFLVTFPDNFGVRKLLTRAELRQGKGEAAVMAFEKYLLDNEVPMSNIAENLIDLAQTLRSPGLAEKYLTVLQMTPAMSEEYAYYNLRQKAIYSDLNEEDFNILLPQKAQLFETFFLIINKRYQEVQLQTTPPNEFPDFWKIFLAWRNGDKYWKRNATLFLKKHKNDLNPTRNLIISLWLGRTPPEKALKMLKRIPAGQEELFYLMLAEFYRKKNKRAKANIYYNKARKYKNSPYRLLIQHFRK